MSGKAQATCVVQAQGARIRFHLPNANDHIQKLIIQSKDFYEKEMLEDIGPRLPENSLVVDAGANIGNHTLFFSAVLGARTIAFEPNPSVLSILEKNIELNKLEGLVEVHPVALGAEAGTGKVVESDAANLGRAQIALGDGATQVARLDEIVGDRHVHLIKVDVEGMEAEVLRGAIDTLKRCKPWLLVEAATVESLESVEEIIRPIGYRKIRVYNDTPTYLFGINHGAAGSSACALIDPQHLSRLPPTQQIVAGMATVAGNEMALRVAVMSLLPQVDRLFLYLNGFSEAPHFVRSNSKISYFLDQDGTQYGDAGKFWGLGQVSDAVYLTCDDDIIYPDDYVSQMVAELAQLAGKGIVAVHGSILLQPNAGYYESNSRAVFHFTNPLMRRRQVHVPGTGTCVFHAAEFRMTLSDFRHPNMADLWVAAYLQREGLPAYVVPRASRWLRGIDVQRPDIYSQSRGRTGTAYDTSRQHEEILASMYPITMLRCESSERARAVHILDAEGADGVAEFIATMGHRERDPIIVVTGHGDIDATRQAALKPELLCEVHFVPRDQPFDTAYRELLLGASERVTAWGLQQGGVLRRIPADEWKTWLESNSSLSAVTL